MATYEIQSFEFFLGMIIWHGILLHVNSVSKFFQSKDMKIDVAIEDLKHLVTPYYNYRETGFKEAMVEAKKIAGNLGIELVFPKKTYYLLKENP